MIGVEDKIKSVILKKTKGSVLFLSDFSDYGTGVSVRKAFQSLKEKNIIKFIAPGIYVKPKYHPIFGELMPTMDDLAKCIAKRDKIKLIPTGLYALNILGLSNQVPLKIIYLTDGSARKIKLLNGEIQFKRTTPKNLLAKNELCALVIQALREIGEGKVKESELNKILSILKNVDKSILKHDMDLAPAWIKEIMKKAL